MLKKNNLKDLHKVWRTVAEEEKRGHSRFLQRILKAQF